MSNEILKTLHDTARRNQQATGFHQAYSRKRLPSLAGLRGCRTLIPTDRGTEVLCSLPKGHEVLATLDLGLEGGHYSCLIS